MYRTAEFVPLIDKFPRFADRFMEYGPSILFLFVGATFVFLSAKGVVEFRHLFWLIPVSTIATFILLVLAEVVLEVLFLGLSYTCYLVLGMLKEWMQQAESFFVFAYLNAILFLLLLISAWYFVFQSFGGKP